MKDYYDVQEEDHERACMECALDNGHTAEEAENCDNGDVGCIGCPFEKKEVKKLEQNPEPIIKITMDAATLANILRSAADSVQAASAAGMNTITIRHDLTLREFLRFCLGEGGRLGE